MQKLAMSKKIMEAQDRIPRGNATGMPSMMNETIPNATYNIPSDIMQEQQTQRPIQMPPQHLDENRILNSKLPEHIKKLMLENPINNQVLVWVVRFYQMKLLREHKDLWVNQQKT